MALWLWWQQQKCCYDDNVVTMLTVLFYSKIGTKNFIGGKGWGWKKLIWEWVGIGLISHPSPDL